jgi:N-acetylglucosaminyldiphosphoundecaprenol N-acetyl-beta-D-mannosaminyltransferase
VKTRKVTGTSNYFGGKMAVLFGVTLFVSNKRRLLSELEYKLRSKDIKVWLATVNPEFVMNALKDEYFLEILQKKTSVNVIDGIGLIWAKKKQEGENGFKIGWEILQGKHRESLITGADLIDDFCAMAERLNKTVYFYGGWQDRAARTASYFLKKYPKLKVVGAQAEDFDFKTKVDFLFVARAMKKQELWIDEHFDKLNVRVVMGVGRSFDYYSGELKRAPVWMRKMGLEWLFSLLAQPSRWKRQLELPKFIWRVIK